MSNAWEYNNENSYLRGAQTDVVILTVSKTQYVFAPYSFSFIIFYLVSIVSISKIAPLPSLIYRFCI